MSFLVLPTFLNFEDRSPVCSLNIGIDCNKTIGKKQRKFIF